jgi:hypothetical protein
MLDEITQLLDWLEQSPLAEVIRATPYLYPVIESLHILGIAIMVGPALAVDFRWLGVGRSIVPVTTTTRCLLPLSHAGFALVALTGLAMFAAIAISVTSSPAAPWKFGLIVVAGMNILAFHNGIYRTVAAWDFDAEPPLPAKISALTSAFAWMGVIIAGRFLAY